MSVEFEQENADKRPPHRDFCGDKSSFMMSQRIQNVAQLRNYIKLQLGSPTICVELSDDQLNAIIADSVQWIWKYYYNHGAYRDYLMMELKPGKTHYKICQDLESVVDFNTSNWLGSINELFTVPHTMLYDQVMTMGNCWQGTCWGNSPSFGDMMGNWNASLCWLEEVKNTFGESYQVRWNGKEHELSVWPAPRKPTRGLMEVYKRQKVEHVFNDVLFKKLAVARAGMLWASGLKKYTMTLAGGGQINSDSLYSQYKDEYDWVIQRIDDESPNGHCMLVG